MKKVFGWILVIIPFALGAAYRYFLIGPDEFEKELIGFFQALLILAFFTGFVVAGGYLISQDK